MFILRQQEQLSVELSGGVRAALIITPIVGVKLLQYNTKTLEY